MTTLTTQEGNRIFYKDRGPREVRPIMSYLDWPLSADDRDNQMLFLLGKDYRVIAHDRRGHGRTEQTDTGNEMDTYASDVAELVRELDLKDAVHVGHSTGGGRVIRYIARSGPGRASKAALMGKTRGWLK
ncbi:pimeloyl-ACP methyl ester carboxylesterase [Pseudochelatococcus lubricantis]|uniref:Pimeloyl-ACP methyl ester carboxylesterase n=1 Tax=Pseudochelatococcus lubricantis TaxID=1538102 RepID=A0ABX0V6J9_9HYPH|nr:pimeloyl-ACP methyl ester carboxylesterase [Pseudochelatococcus lubricantis]